jgi:hypothetical protein
MRLKEGTDLASSTSAEDRQGCSPSKEVSMKVSLSRFGVFLLVPFISTAWLQNSPTGSHRKSKPSQLLRNRRSPTPNRKIRLSRRRRIWRRPRNFLATIARCAMVLRAMEKVTSPRPWDLKLTIGASHPDLPPCPMARCSTSSSRGKAK